MDATTDPVSERIQKAHRAREEAQHALDSAHAEGARLALLDLADDLPGLTGIRFSADYEYDDQASYYLCVNVYALPEDVDDDYAADDAMQGFGIEGIRLLCGVGEDDYEGEITLAEARERSF